MSTLTQPTARRDARPAAPATGGVTFLNLVRSEWIKLVSLRSTWWTLGLTVLIMVLFALMMGASAGFIADSGGEVGDMAGFGPSVVTFGYLFGQVAVAVLGALIITGEYSTGMIRSTMAADPKRTGVILAKALVLAVVVFVTSLIGVAISFLITIPMLEPHGFAIDLGDAESLRMVLGAPIYITLISLLALGLGLIIRNSAGTIASVLGIVLLIPIVFSLLGGWQEWVGEVTPFLPGAAGERLMQPAEISTFGAGGSATVLDPWVGGALLLGYVVVVFGIGLTLLKKRDI